MQYELYKVNSETFEREFKIDGIKTFNWQDNLINMSVSFDYTSKNKNVRIDKQFSDEKNLKIDDWIELYCPYNKKTVFYGKINKIDETDKNFIKYLGYDKGLECDKIKVTKDFKDTTVTNAIKETCKEANIEAGDIEEINKKVKKIFKNMTVSEILAEVYKIGIEKGEKDGFYFDCKNGKVNLYKFEENNNLKGYIANIYSINSFDHVSSFKIVKSENGEELNFTVFGNCNIHKGVKTKINLETIGIKGTYLITSSTHNIEGSKETVVADLKYIEEDDDNKKENL